MWHLNYQRHSNGFVVEMGSLEVEPVVAEHLSVIRHENNNRILALACFVEGIQHGADAVVNQFHHGAICGADTTMVSACEIAHAHTARFVVSPDVVKLLPGGLVETVFGSQILDLLGIDRLS